MNANQSTDSIQTHAGTLAGCGKTAAAPTSKSTVVFKRSFHFDRLNESDRRAAREMLQRLMASRSLRPLT